VVPSPQFTEGETIFFPRNGKPVARRGRKAMGPPGACALPGDRQAAERRRVMVEIRKWVVNFLKREDGPTAVEYAVMLALIIVVCVGAISLIGSNANATFNTVASQLGATAS
jgi:pilus assembly protein Flp/PilA